MEDDSKHKVKNLFITSLTVTTVYLFLLAISLYSDKYGNSITSFVVATSGNMNMGWFVTYVVITILVGISISTAVYLIASYLVAKRKMKFVENTIDLLITQGNEHVKTMDLSMAKQVYAQLQNVYSKANPKLQKKVYDKIVQFHGKVSILGYALSEEAEMPMTQGI